MTGTVEKKCSPSTRCGCEVAAARRAIGMEEVFDASGTSAGKSRSSSPKTTDFTVASSYTASMTIWAPASASSWVVGLIRASTEAALTPSSLPAASARARLVSIRPRERSSTAASGSY